MIRIVQRSLFILVAVGLHSMLLVTPVWAEEKFEDLLKRAQELKDQKKYAQAISELSWATKQLEKLHLAQLESVFPKTVGEFTGGEFQSNSALGLVTIERSYVGGGTALKASLSGSAASEGSARQGMGVLAGFAGMAAMMGQGPGSDTVRIKGNRGVLNVENGKTSLTISLPSGMLLQVESQKGNPTKEQVIALAEGFNFEALSVLTQPQ